MKRSLIFTVALTVTIISNVNSAQFGQSFSSSSITDSTGKILSKSIYTDTSGKFLSNENGLEIINELLPPFLPNQISNVDKILPPAVEVLPPLVNGIILPPAITLNSNLPVIQIKDFNVQTIDAPIVRSQTTTTTTRATTTSTTKRPQKTTQPLSFVKQQQFKSQSNFRQSIISDSNEKSEGAYRVVGNDGTYRRTNDEGAYRAKGDNGTYRPKGNSGKYVHNNAGAYRHDDRGLYKGL